MEMQNGVHYEKTKADLIIEKPFGIALLAGEDRNVIYSRIVNLWSKMQEIVIINVLFLNISHFIFYAK